MVKVYVFYSLTHNKFVIKYSKSLSNAHDVDYKNQYNQVLLQIIDLDDLETKRSLKYTLKRIKYISRINSLYRKEIKEIKSERRRHKCSWF